MTNEDFIKNKFQQPWWWKLIQWRREEEEDEDLKDFEIRAQLRMEEGFLKIRDFDVFLFFTRNDNFTPHILVKKTHKTKDKTGFFLFFYFH